jgi:hypothetical protein
MRINTFSAGTLGLAGLVAAGALAFPATATTSDNPQDQALKRDEDTPDIVLVSDDDDDDLDRAMATGTRDNTGDNTGGTRTNDNTGTGAQTGRDKSRNRQVKDWTNDGKGKHNRDFSNRHTNDRSRHNTRR